MAALTVQDVRSKYGLFNEGDLDKVVDQFAPEAEYRQLDSNNVAVGREEIRKVMEGWRHFFGDASQIEGVTVTEAPDMVAMIAGAVQCFTVDFIGVGVYQNDVPGLESVAPAHNRPVRVPIGETVWFDREGQFLRVDNTMKVTALQ